MQPAPILRVRPDENRTSWTTVLREVNASSYVEAKSNDGSPPKRYHMEDGLAGNIRDASGRRRRASLAACVDIWDSDKKNWGAGGLCCYDPAAGRWQRINMISGRPVRWVSLLETAGDALWVAFREGSGLAGDRLEVGNSQGRGWSGIYRPLTTRVILARYAAGVWSSFPLPPEPQSALGPTFLKLGESTVEQPPRPDPAAFNRNTFPRRVAILTGPRFSTARSTSGNVRLAVGSCPRRARFGYWIPPTGIGRGSDAQELDAFIVRDGEVSGRERAARFAVDGPSAAVDISGTKPRVCMSVHRRGSRGGRRSLDRLRESQFDVQIARRGDQPFRRENPAMVVHERQDAWHGW